MRSVPAGIGRALALLLLAAPLAAQAPGDLPLAFGDAVQVRFTGDTAWQDVEIVGVGACLAVKRPQEETADGYFATAMSGITALRKIDADRRWHEPPAAQLRNLQRCRVGGGQAPDPECGGDPQAARFAVLGFLDGAQRGGAAEGPWGPYLTLTRDEVHAVEGKEGCERLLTRLALADPGSAQDPLPLQGILDLDGLGTVVVRSASVGPNGHAERSMLLLNGDLQRLSYLRFTY